MQERKKTYFRHADGRFLRAIVDFRVGFFPRTIYAFSIEKCLKKCGDGPGNFAAVKRILAFRGI
jgi:hypothetical protein